MSKFEITYGIEDGYAGGDRRHYVQMDADTFYPGMTDEEIEREIFDIADEHARENISVYIPNLDEAVAWAKERIAEMEAEDAAGVTS